MQCILRTASEIIFQKFHFCGREQGSDSAVSGYSFYGLVLYSLQFYQLKTLCRNNMEHVKTLYYDPMCFSLG